MRPLGRTTLSGEGLQHQDGSSHLVAATVPNCRAYDPCFAYELAVIMEEGMKRMIDDRRDEFFYVTVMNENYAQPSLPEGAQDGIVRGMYLLERRGQGAAPVRLVGSGTILREVIAAAEILDRDYGIASEVYSATSFSELARDAAEVNRRNRLSPGGAPERSHVETLLAGDAPVVAASDYVRAVPGQIAPYLDARMTLLGTDGFGRSAHRAGLRRFFEVDRQHVVIAAIAALVRRGEADAALLARAQAELGDGAPEQAPWLV